MKNLIVNSLELISKIAILLCVIAGFMSGMATGHIWQAFVGTCIGFVGSVVIFGIVFVLLEMNAHLRVIRRHFEEMDGISREHYEEE